MQPCGCRAGSHRTHKLAAILRILNSYPHLRFVLIGDTGQSDAAIYAETVRTYPGRIIAVYLRDVSPDGLKPDVRTAMDAIETAGVPLVTAETLNAAARHAEEAGLVDPGTADWMALEIESDLQRLKGWKWPRPSFARPRRGAGDGVERKLRRDYWFLPR